MKRNLRVSIDPEQHNADENEPSPWNMIEKFTKKENVVQPNLLQPTMTLDSDDDDINESNGGEEGSSLHRSGYIKEAVAVDADFKSVPYTEELRLKAKRVINVVQGMKSLIKEKGSQEIQDAFR